MYAIIQDGGRQYKIVEGQLLTVDYREIPSGEAVKFDQVVAVSDGSKLQLGKPTLSGAVVTAEVVGVAQGPKLVVQKFRRRKNMRRRNGHRQMFTQVKISKIQL